MHNRLRPKKREYHNTNELFGGTLQIPSSTTNFLKDTQHITGPLVLNPKTSIKDNGKTVKYYKSPVLHRFVVSDESAD